MSVSSALLSRLQNPKLLNWLPAAAATGSAFNVVDPYQQHVIANIPDYENCNDAIAKAHAAFPMYSQTLASQRSKWLKKLADEQRKNVDDLAMILSLESAKPIREARGEIEYGASYLEWFAEEAKRMYGVTIPAPFANRNLVVTREPVGVCGLIVPFNFPNAMLSRKAAPALAAGCTVVARPSEDVPLSAIAFNNMVNSIFPDGVFNLVTTSRKHAGEIGKQLSTDPRIAKVSFTGSTAVGKMLLEQCASTVKRTSMELGGNAAFGVFDCCSDLDAAVEGLLAAKFRYGGQTCIAANRILLHAKIMQPFLDKLVKRLSTLKIGKD